MAWSAAMLPQNLHSMPRRPIMWALVFREHPPSLISAATAAMSATVMSAGSSVDSIPRSWSALTVTPILANSLLRSLTVDSA